MARRDKNNSAFAAALSEQLARRSLTQSDLARASGVTRAYVSRLANNAAPSPEWVDKIAASTAATPVEYASLSVAAAASHGFDMRPYQEVVAENKALRTRVAELETLLAERKT